MSQNTTATKGLPHNWETEKALLGGILVMPGVLPDVRASLRPEHFHRPAHGVLFRVLCQMADKGTPPDLITVCDHIEAAGLEQQVGGLAYVMGLMSVSAVSEMIPTYARRVRLHAERAAAIQRVREIEEALQSDPDADPAALFSSALDATERNRLDRGTWHSYGEVVPARLDEIRKRAENPGQLPGISSGIPELDALVGGLEAGCVYVLAGRPSQGKSLVEDQIAASVARNFGSVGKFQLEMAKEKVAERVIVREGRVDNSRIRRGDLDEESWRALCDGAERGAQLPIYIDDTPGLTIEELRGRARALKRMCPDLALLTIDYLQLLGTSQAPKGSNGESRMAIVSKQVKVMAKELGVPVIEVAQLSRACEQRENKRPIMSDLRESGQIEQDADAIVFVYRDDYYNKEASAKPGVIELIVAKARDGRLGTVERRFRGEFYAVDPIERRYEEPAYVGDEEDGRWGDVGGGWR